MHKISGLIKENGTKIGYRNRQTVMSKSVDGIHQQ
jgi:hypothetical protein